jgi:transcription elongation GreA/GreB family factor
MFRMDKQLLKNRLFERCLEIHRQRIVNLETAMKDAEESANQYGPQSDIFDSQIMEMIRSRDMYATQLSMELVHLETLHKIDPTIRSNKVEFGSVVETELQKVFVSIGLGKVLIENDQYFAISTKVPFFEAMKGKTKGEVFEFRGKNIRILDIF